jgi:hypothetical protein
VDLILCCADMLAAAYSNSTVHHHLVLPDTMTLWCCRIVVLCACLGWPQTGFKLIKCFDCPECWFLHFLPVKVMLFGGGSKKRSCGTAHSVVVAARGRSADRTFCTHHEHLCMACLSFANVMPSMCVEQAWDPLDQYLIECQCFSPVSSQHLPSLSGFQLFIGSRHASCIDKGQLVLPHIACTLAALHKYCMCAQFRLLTCHLCMKMI